MRSTIFGQALAISLLAASIAGAAQAQTAAPARDPSTLIAVLAGMGAFGYRAAVDWLLA